VLQRGQMMWDEAEHAVTGLVFLNDIQRLDFISLAYHCYQQLLWPFLYPLFLSIFFLLFGPSIIMGRALSLVIYFLFSISMYFIGREMVKKNKGVSGILCSVFALITGSFYLSASEIMLEILALLFFTLSLLFFLKSLRNKKLYSLVSIFILLTFFSKTNFGIVLILAIIIYFLIQEKLRFTKFLTNAAQRKILAPVFIIILIWLMIPPDRLFTFLGFLVNRPEGPPPLSLEGLLYYPTQLYIYSGFLILLFAAALAISFRHLKNDKVRFLLITALLVILLNFFHQNKKIRYILDLYPPLFSLTAFHLTNLYTKIKHKRKQIAFSVLMPALMAVFLFHFSSNVRLYGYSFSVSEPLDFIKNNTMDSNNIFVLGEFNELSPGLITWHLSNTTSIKYITASSYSAWQFENSSGNLERPGNPTPDSEGMERFIAKHDFDKIVLIEVKNSSVFYDKEDYLVYNRWKLDYIPIVMENGNYSVENMKSFENIGVQVTILKKLSN
jgi:hypothetical protein